MCSVLLARGRREAGLRSPKRTTLVRFLRERTTNWTQVVHSETFCPNPWYPSAHGIYPTTFAQGRRAEPAADPGGGQAAVRRTRARRESARHRPPRRRRRRHDLPSLPRQGGADRHPVRGAARAHGRADGTGDRRSRPLARSRLVLRVGARATSTRPRPQGADTREPRRARARLKAPQEAPATRREAHRAGTVGRRGAPRLRDARLRRRPADGRGRHRRRPRGGPGTLAPLPDDRAAGAAPRVDPAGAAPRSRRPADADRRSARRHLDAPKLNETLHRDRTPRSRPRPPEEAASEAKRADWMTPSSP